MPAIHNIEIQQGLTFREQIIIYQSGTLNQAEVDRLTDAEVQALSKVDLTGATIEGKIRERFDDATAIADFVIENRNDAAGTFDIVLAFGTTDALDFEDGVYDIEILYSASDKRRELEGIVKLTPGVTY